MSPSLAPKALHRLSAATLLLAWPITSNMPSALAAPAATTATDATTQDAGAPGTTAPEFSIGEGEIRLDGKIYVPNPAQKTCILRATDFTLPSGKSSHLRQPKIKTIIVDEQTLVHVRGDVKQVVALTALTNQVNGTSAVVIGKDMGSGKNLPAREIAVWDQVKNGVYSLSPQQPRQ